MMMTVQTRAKFFCRLMKHVSLSSCIILNVHHNATYLVILKDNRVEIFLLIPSLLYFRLNYQRIVV